MANSNAQTPTPKPTAGSPPAPEASEMVKLTRVWMHDGAMSPPAPEASEMVKAAAEVKAVAEKVLPIAEAVAAKSEAEVKQDAPIAKADATKAEGAIERIAKTVWSDTETATSDAVQLVKADIVPRVQATAHVLVAGSHKSFTFVGEYADHLAALLAGHGSFAGILQAVRAWLRVRRHEAIAGIVAALAVILLTALVIAHDHRGRHPGIALHGADLLSADGRSVLAHVDSVASSAHLVGSRYTVLHIAGGHTIAWDGPVRILP